MTDSGTGNRVEVAAVPPTVVLPPDEGRIVGPDDDSPPVDAGGTAAVLRNRNFLLLWLAQVATQIGGNMVVYGLTVLVFSSTHSDSMVALLLLTFLAPAVFFSAVAGVYVDRLDRRLILIVTNLLRAIFFGLVYLAGVNVAAIFVLNIAISTVTTFFAPAEAAMIPELVPRRQLLAANGLFTFTQNVAFALGFALLGPLVVKLAGPEVLILTVAFLYLVAMGFVITLPSVLPAVAGMSAGEAVHGTERAVASVVGELREGLDYIRAHRSISWSLIYLGVTASLIGVLGVLGPHFATETLGLTRVGLRRRGPAARDRGRDRDPPAQQLRPLLPAPAAHGGRPRRPRAPAHGAARRPDRLPASSSAPRRRRHSTCPGSSRCWPSCSGSPSWPGSPTRSSRSRPRPRSRRSCRRRSGGASSGCSTCSSRWPASCRSSSSRRSRTTSGRPWSSWSSAWP